MQFWALFPKSIIPLWSFVEALPPSLRPPISSSLRTGIGNCRQKSWTNKNEISLNPSRTSIFSINYCYCYHPSHWMTTDTSAGLSASPHNMGGGGRVQVCNNMVVLCVIYCDSPEVELCLYVLEPRLWLMLPKKEVQRSQLGTISLFHFPSINNTTLYLPPT